MKHSRRILACSLFCLFCCLIQTSSAHEQNSIIKLSTTTSVVSSGLMDRIKSAFESDTGYTLSVVAVGTGRALRSAREGKADVIIVHSPAAEKKFMAAGLGFVRQPLMRNQFILAGPEADPARVTDSTNVAGAFSSIAVSQNRFVSRGDDSGTHKKELEIWKTSGVDPYGDWYIEYGHGMGKTLSYANKVSAYILVDWGTWLARRKELDLVELYRDDALLDNPYHVIAVKPGRNRDVNNEGAKQFVDWMTSKPGQDIIRNFTLDGEHLYIPSVDS